MRKQTPVKFFPVRDEADHARAMKQIAALWDKKGEKAAAAELEIWVTLVHAYEEKHHAIEPPDPIDAILFRMEQEELSNKDLEPILGSRARVWEVLHRRRRLTLPMMRRLQERLGISAKALLAEPGKR